MNGRHTWSTPKGQTERRMTRTLSKAVAKSIPPRSSRNIVRRNCSRNNGSGKFLSLLDSTRWLHRHTEREEARHCVSKTTIRPFNSIIYTYNCDFDRLSIDNGIESVSLGEIGGRHDRYHWRHIGSHRKSFICTIILIIRHDMIQINE